MKKNFFIVSDSYRKFVVLLQNLFRFCKSAYGLMGIILNSALKKLGCFKSMLHAFEFDLLTLSGQRVEFGARVQT
jgi:hypothetical protein